MNKTTIDKAKVLKDHFLVMRMDNDGIDKFLKEKFAE